MTIRASIARRFGAEDPADSIATNPLPQMDWLKERALMFFCHPIPPASIEQQNPAMLQEGFFRPVQYPGLRAGEGRSTTYGFNLVINARAAGEAGRAARLLPLPDERPGGLLARHRPVHDGPPVRLGGQPRSAVLPACAGGADRDRARRASATYNDLADAMHRAVQRIMLNGADITTALNAAAAEVDRAAAIQRRG